MASLWSQVCDAWMTDLTTNVAGLATAIQHKYAPWSPELLYASANERHVAIYPTSEGAEQAQNLLTIPSHLATQSYVVLVWEDASDRQGALQDDDTANAAWLDLAEAIRGRFMLLANIALGNSAITDTRYAGVAFHAVGVLRVQEVRFVVRVARQET